MAKRIPPSCKDLHSFFAVRPNDSDDADDIHNDSDVEIVSAAELLSLPASKKSKHRHSGYNHKWKEEFSWIDCIPDGMICLLCRKHNRRPHKVALGKASWVDIPCKTFTKQSVKNHAKSDSHKDAVTLEAQLCSSVSGDIRQLLAAVQSAEKKAMIGAMKCMYWLCKQEIAHTTKFSDLLDLAKSIGVTYLNDLQKGGNAHYTSERFMQELISYFGEMIRNSILHQVRASPFFALLIDETTDVAVINELIIYARYLGSDRKVHTSFLGIIEIPDGCAQTILSAIRELCEKYELDLSGKLVAFGSDGAAVMIGCRSGVSTLLKQISPWVIANHCVAHRLALACAQAADEVPYLKRFKAVLGQLYRYYQNSAVRSSGLKEIQAVLNDPILKLTQAKDVRWLSHERAVQNLRQCFPSVLASLEREASERHDAQALGLSSFMETYKFLATLLMLCDILPCMACLSKAFQKQDLDYTLIKPLISGSIATLNNLKTSPGEHFLSLDKFLEEKLMDFGIVLPNASFDFKTAIYDKYIDTLIQHIRNRFPDIDLLTAFSIFDGKAWPIEDSTSLQSFGEQSLHKLSSHYTSVVDDKKLSSEWNIFKNMAISEASPLDVHTMGAKCVMETIVANERLSELFPNIAKIALAALLIPASTADCERGFSTLKRIKTSLRNRLNNATSSELLFISIKGPALNDFNFDEACTLWGSKRNRRINVLS